MRPNSSTPNPCGAGNRAGDSGAELSLSLAATGVAGGTTFVATASEAVAAGDGADWSECASSHTVAAGLSNAIGPGGSRCVDNAYSNTLVLMGSLEANGSPLNGGEAPIATVPVGPTRGIAIVPVGPTRGIAIVPVGPTRGVATVPIGSTRGAAALGRVTSGSARMKSSALWKRSSGSFASARITASTRG